MNALALTDDTCHGKAPGSEAVSFVHEGVFHIISPGSCLCAPGRRQNQPSLAHCLAVKNNPLLTQVLAQVRDVKLYSFMVTTASWQQSRKSMSR